MADWSFLSTLLDQAQAHSTAGGKAWLAVLFLFRVLVLAVGVENIWGDEQAAMFCNTHSVGCRSVCYDASFPVSHARLWLLQVLLVSTPSLLYLGHVLLLRRRSHKRRRRRPGAPEPEGEEPRGPRGPLLVSYVLQLLAKILLEAAFVGGQYLLYGFLLMPPKITCSQYPCRGAVECFITRPAEKSVFIVFMTAVSVLSALLNLGEMIHLLVAHARRGGGGAGKGKGKGEVCV